MKLKTVFKSESKFNFQGKVKKLQLAKKYFINKLLIKINKVHPQFFYNMISHQNQKWTLIFQEIYSINFKIINKPLKTFNELNMKI